MIFLNKLCEILKQPLPLNHDIVKNIAGSITFGAFVFFFLIILSHSDCRYYQVKL